VVGGGASGGDCSCAADLVAHGGFKLDRNEQEEERPEGGPGAGKQAEEGWVAGATPERGRTCSRRTSCPAP